MRTVLTDEEVRAIESKDRVCVQEGGGLAIRVIPFARAIESAVLAKVADREREAVRRAWDAAAKFTEGECKMPSPEAFAREGHRYLAATYPTAERVTLSDGSVVTRDGSHFRRYGERCGLISSTIWRDMLLSSDTGADFDAVKALAQRVEGA